MNIYAKLLEVRKAVPYLQKGDKGHQYQYTGSSTVLGAVRAKLDEVGVILEPRVTGKTVHLLNECKTVFTEIDMTMTWVNVDNPEEKIECPWYAQGFDNGGEKGVGKAYTYAEKYFILKYFNIATDKDDPDAFQEKLDNVMPINKADKPADKAKMSAITTMVRKSQLSKEAYTQLVLKTLGHDRYTELTSAEADKMITTLGQHQKQGVAQ